MSTSVREGTRDTPTGEIVTSSTLDEILVSFKNDPQQMQSLQQWVTLNNHSGNRIIGDLDQQICQYLVATYPPTTFNLQGKGG